MDMHSNSPEAAQDSPSTPTNGSAEPMGEVKRRHRRKYGATRLVTLDELDGRTVACKEARRLIRTLTDELRDPTPGQQQYITRAALLGAMAADFETRWVAGQKINIGDYLATVNTQRRVLETLGVERHSKDVTPNLDQYLEAKARARAAQQQEIIDNAEDAALSIGSST